MSEKRGGVVPQRSHPAGGFAGALRACLVASLMVAALAAAPPAALGATSAQGQGRDGSFSAALNPGPGGKYTVSITATNARRDIASTSVQLDIVDAAGTRTFRNPYIGGRVQDTLAFDNRGPCTVRITFRFTTSSGQVQSNTDRPVTINYPAQTSTATPTPDSGQGSSSSRAGSSGPAGAGGGGRCVTPAGMTGLIDQDNTDSQKPWRRQPGSRVQINFVVDTSITPEWRADLEHGATAWNRSPCLDTRIVDACPSGGNCVSVSALGSMDADGNFDAVEKGGFTTGGKITLLNKLNRNQRRNVAVHEMGHAVGLVHRKTSHVMMNADTFDDVFEPDQTDYKNLLFSYDRMQRSP